MKSHCETQSGRSKERPEFYFRFQNAPPNFGIHVSQRRFNNFKILMGINKREWAYLGLAL